MTERRRTPLQPLGAVLGGADFVWEAKARAEAARAAATPQEAGATLAPARNAEAEAMVLALLKKFGGKPEEEPQRPRAMAPVPVRAVMQARAPLPAPAPAPAPTHAGAYARPDDDKPADPTWLQMELTQVPTLQRAGFRGAREQHTRGAWRAALGGLLQRGPGQLASPGGALVMQVRRATATGADPRTQPAYCASPGWGPAAYKFAGVEGRIHQEGSCWCLDG